MRERKSRSHKTLISVVLINDDANQAHVVCQLCERYGDVTMHSSRSGEEAIQWLSHHPADVIVTDFQMPEMNGIELIKKLRTLGYTAPCILFTTAGIEIVIQESTIFGVGIFGYLTKDPPVQSLIPVLMELIIRAAASVPRKWGGYTDCRGYGDHMTGHEPVKTNMTDRSSC